MKKTFLAIAGIVGGYILFALANMGVVLLLFNHKSPPFGIALALTILITAVSGFFIGRLVHQFSKTQSWILYTVLGLVSVVILASLFHDRSLEPSWYKIIYLVVLIPSALLGARK